MTHLGLLIYPDGATPKSSPHAQMNSFIHVYPSLKEYQYSTLSTVAHDSRSRDVTYAINSTYHNL